MITSPHRFPITPLLLISLVIAPRALAQVEGPNGHFYQVVMETVPWQTAKESAESATFNGVHGHLATITSLEEDSFVESLRQEAGPGVNGALWIGGSQESSAGTSRDGWFWVNGEGAIPMNGGDGYANWQQNEPNDYNGPGSENFLTTGHFHQFGWNDESNGGQVTGYVIEFPSGGKGAAVSVITIDPIAIENGSSTNVAVFEFQRSGDLSLDLPVFYSIHGTASNGIDYNEISRSIVIPANLASVQLTIAPRPDALTVVEPLETVGIRIEPSLILTPSAAYDIDLDHREAAAVIYEGQPPESPAIEIAIPRNGMTYKSGEVVNILVAVHAAEPAASVDIYSGEIKIGSVTRSVFIEGLSFFEFAWNAPAIGSADLYARTTIGGQQISSSSVRIIIEQTTETPVVSIRFVETPVPAIVPATDWAGGYFEVSRTGSTAQNLQVFYSVTGSATADVDYDRLQNYVVIGAGRTNARINVVVKDDLLDEPTETVIAYLVPVEHSADPTAPSNYIIHPDFRNATVPIYDNDLPAERSVISVAVAPAEVIEQGGSGYQHATKVTVSRSGSLDLAQRVYLAYEGTATPNVDYGRAMTEVIIPPGSSSIEFPMAATPDGHVEGVETAIVRVAPPNFPTDPHTANRLYDINPEHGSATLTIFDAQSPPTLPKVSITAIFGSTHEPAPNIDVAPAIFALRRTGPTNNSLVVSLAYSGTAGLGIDYPNPGRFVGFKPGQVEVRVEIYANDDTIPESTETILVTVDPSPSIPQTYAVDPERGSVTLKIIDDDAPSGPLVTIESPDPLATELPPTAAGLDTAEFLFTRWPLADTSGDLRVFFSIHGTAKNGEDFSLPNSVVIPAGKNSVRLQLVPIADTPARTHHYEFVTANGISWEAARTAAEQSVYQGVTGHLATITSAAEDELVHSLHQQAGMQVMWIGGYQDPGEMSVTEGWKWVNDEGPIPGSNNSGTGYANWLAGEPNDYWGPGSENHIVIGWLNSFGWNDQQNAAVQGYVIEYDLPPTPGVPIPTESMETVALRLEPSPSTGPLPTYHIEWHNRIAVAVIFEGAPPAVGAIDFAFPSAGFTYPNDDEVEFYVAAYHPTVEIQDVTYTIFGNVIGSSSLDPNSNEDPEGGLEIHRFHWTEASPGTYVIVATAQLPTGPVLSSSEIPFMVQNGSTNQPPVVTIIEPSDGAVFILGEPIPVRAVGSDPDGTIVNLSLFVDGSLVAGPDPNALQNTLQNLSAGPHSIEVRGVDLSGENHSASVSILVRHPDAISFVERRMPATFTPGQAFVVQLIAEPREGTHAFAVEDQPPQGWAVTGPSHEGEFDAATGKVKFGPFIDSARRTLTYWVTAPNNATGRHQFTGRSSANGAPYPITGDEFIELVQQYHPADTNRSFSISLVEVTAYAAAWKGGDSWPVGPVPIPLAYVTSAGRIWKRGEAYRFDHTAGPAPACWVPTSEATSAFLTAAANGSALRMINGTFAAGVETAIQIITTPAAGTSCYALEEKPPRGWIVSEISHSGFFDEAAGVIRWGAFFDATARNFSYVISPPAGVTAVGAFSGHVSFDGQLAELNAYSPPVIVPGSAPMEIISSSNTANGVTLEISGPPGQTAVVEGTTDLIEWAELSAIFLPNGTVEFTDTSRDAAHRFYRLRVQ